MFDISAPPAAWKPRLGHWSIYAAAAGASLAMASKADADIMYSGPVDLTVSVSPTGTNSTSDKQITIGGYLASFFVENQTSGGGKRQALAVIGFGSLGFVQGTDGVKKYAASQPIRATGSINNLAFLRTAFSSVGSRGAFGPGTVTGFVGFKAPNGTLGWLQVKVEDRNSDGFPDEAEIIDFAYNSTPGGAINAGQISSVPEPSSVSLGLLAMGASGLIAWRRRRSQQRAQ